MSKQKAAQIAVFGLIMTGLCGCNSVINFDTTASSDSTAKKVEIVEATGGTSQNETEISENETSTKSFFEGEWHRTDTHSSGNATITISNVSDDGFDFEGYFQGYGNMGQEEGRAVFTSDNEAVYTQEASDYSEEAFIYFSMDGEDLEISSEGFLMGMGNHVYADGKYTTEEPTYTNANIIAETFTDDELQAMKDMLSEDDYTNGFIDNTQSGIVTSETVTMYYGAKAKHVNCFYPGLANFVGYDLLITDDGDIYYSHVDRGFSTNDPDYLGEEMPTYTVD